METTKVADSEFACDQLVLAEALTERINSVSIFAVKPIGPDISFGPRVNGNCPNRPTVPTIDINILLFSFIKS